MRPVSPSVRFLGAVAGFAAADATAKDDDLDEVLSSGDEVVSLFERSGKRPARMGSHAGAALRESSGPRSLP